MHRWLLLISLIMPLATQAEGTDYQGISKKFIQAWVGEKEAEVHKLLSDNLKKEFPEDSIEELIKRRLRGKGKMKLIGKARKKDEDTWIFPVEFSKGTLHFTLSIDHFGQVIGFLVKVPKEAMRVPKRNTVKMSLPFKDRMLVVWGGDTKKLNAHNDFEMQKYAFDLVQVDEKGSTHKNGGLRNSDYYCWGKNVLAPASGVVIEAIDGVRDNEPGSMNAFMALGNAVFIRHKENEISVLAHLQQNSINVKKGQKVQRGKPVGKCGNSGNSSEPHMHVHLQNNPVFQEGKAIKVRFSRVEVTRKGATKRVKAHSPIRGDLVKGL